MPDRRVLFRLRQWRQLSPWLEETCGGLDKPTWECCQRRLVLGTCGSTSHSSRSSGCFRFTNSLRTFISFGCGNSASRTCFFETVHIGSCPCLVRVYLPGKVTGGNFVMGC